jgi:hypothetical protein
MTDVRGDASATIGPCCGCGATQGVKNILMLNRRSPSPGKGWGCVVCGLPFDGAVAVMCDACLGTKPKFVCIGYPASDGRCPIGECPPEKFEHDMAKHAEDEDVR